MSLSDDERIARGRQATHELRITAEVFEALRKLMTDDMLQCHPTEVDQILKQHIAIRLLESVRRALFAVVQDGEIAQAAADAGLVSRN